jgi:hypothetical protein
MVSTNGTVLMITLKENAVGIGIEADLGVDVSDADSITFHFTSPQGTLSTVTGAFVDDGADGLVDCQMSVAETSPIGTWYVQVEIGVGSNVYPSEIATYRVTRNLFA